MMTHAASNPVERSELTPIVRVGSDAGSADRFCRKFCTRKLGWDAAKREECRMKTACNEYREQAKPNIPVSNTGANTKT